MAAPGAPACPLIVMAKAPRPGYAKTRLVPALGEAGAAALAAALLDHALQQAMQSAIGPVDLSCAPHAADPLLLSHAARARNAATEVGATPGLNLSDQGTGDLGARMAAAFARWLPVHGQALMTGTDCPALDAPLLRRAAAALAVHDAVFVPAHDGGYALIGLRGQPEAFAPLFSDMPWSTPQLMAQTRLRLSAAGLRHLELPALPDIDEAADLQHLGAWPHLAPWAGLAQAAPLAPTPPAQPAP